MSFSGHNPRKRFGQHWLRDASVLQHIVDAAELGSDDRVLEVGPGRGALTERLLASPSAAVHAVELDRDLVSGLQQRFGSENRFSLLQGDVLQVPLHLPNGSLASKVVANIPYNITGPLLDRLIGRLDRPVVLQALGSSGSKRWPSASALTRAHKLQRFERAHAVVATAAACVQCLPLFSTTAEVLRGDPPRSPRC